MDADDLPDISGIQPFEAFMIYELAPQAHRRAAALFGGRWFDEAFIDSVFEGTQSGRLFVDDPATPRAALLCRSYEYYVAGDPDAPYLRRFIADAPREAGVFGELYGYCALSRDWERALLDDSEGQVRRIGRRRFRFPSDRSLRIDWRATLGEDRAMLPVDRELAERAVAEVFGGVPGIGAFMGGMEAFVRRGFGFCVAQHGRIASVAHTGSVSAGYADIDIITAEAYRGRGLATLAAAACVDETLRRGLVPTWHTDTTNEASMATARKIGFEEGRPFSQLSPPWGAKLRLSERLWRADGGEQDDGVAVRWRRVGA